MSTLYEIDHVTKAYKQRTVLDISSLTIAEGQTLALIGPSGAGKSTLLRLLCGLESPTTGTVRYAGVIVDEKLPLAARREITLVFQRPLLLDTSVWHNVAYGLRIRRQHARARIAAMLALLGLEHLAHARAQTLSGGEMQRVALARALVLQPRVLLLDEATANLDPHNVAIMETAISTLQHESRCTVVLATHNLHQARRLAARTAMLLDGRMLEVGPTETMLSTPVDPRTQAFVSGAMVY